MESAAGINRFNSGEADGDMIWIPAGTFRIRSDRHYPEEALAHRVTVEWFCINPTPATNKKFGEFVQATNYVTFAVLPPDPGHYPGILPHMLYTGSLVFASRGTHASSISATGVRWWTFPKSNFNGLDHHPVVHVAQGRLSSARTELLPPVPSAARHAEAIDTSTSHFGY